MSEETVAGCQLPVASEERRTTFRLEIDRSLAVLVFLAMVLAFSFKLALQLHQAEMDREADQRQMQKIESLQKLLPPEPGAAPQSEQVEPDFRLKRNSYHSRGPMRVYLSARFQRREEMRRYAEQLRAEAIEVVSAWHDIDVASVDGFTGLDDQRRAWLAILDLQQLSGTNAIAVFSDAGGSGSSAKEVETGIAIALGKRVLLVGDRENRYQCLPDVEHFPAWPDAYARILELRGTDAMTTREAAREAGTTVQQIGMWIREGRLPAAKRNGRYVIARNYLDRAKAQHLRARADALTAINSNRLFPVKG